MPEPADPIPSHLAVIITDLQELIRLADGAEVKLGTLAYLLECALIEAKRLAEKHEPSGRWLGAAVAGAVVRKLIVLTALDRPYNCDESRRWAPTARVGCDKDERYLTT
jgi:hypothetical protein